MAVLEALGQPLSAFRNIRIENASMTTFTLEDGKCVIEDMNDVTHLLSLVGDLPRELL